jgi:hypothetical protein
MRSAAGRPPLSARMHFDPHRINVVVEGGTVVVASPG